MSGALRVHRQYVHSVLILMAPFSSPLDTDYSIRSSPRRTVVDPYGVRLVQKARTDTRRYDRALALPSFRPVHPALAFDDEGF